MSRKRHKKPVEEPVEPAQPALETVQPDVVEPVAAAPSDDRTRKHLALWLAVGGTAAVIVVMWFLLLPMQLGEVRLPNAKDLSRWSVVQTAKEQTRSFEDNLQAIRQRLTELTQKSQAASVQPQQVNIDIEQLRQKLEAAALRNEQPPINEAKK